MKNRPETISFYCDTMLGRLAKWLRLGGYHAEYQREIDDWEMVRYCSREGLVLLTRDTGVMARWQIRQGKIRALLLDGSDFKSQLSEVRNEFSLASGQSPLCPECNLPLEAATRDEARERVPDYVLRTQDSFHVCPCCRRIYWQGTHWRHIAKVLKLKP